MNNDSKVDSDTVPGKIEPNLDSIKIVRIDGFLHEKCIWDSKKWIPICRFDGCKEVTNDNLCKVHKNIIKHITGEKIEKNGKFYKWTGKTWELLCSVEFCEKISFKNGKCNFHANNPTSIYTVSVNNIYDSIKNEVLIKKRKEGL